MAGKGGRDEYKEQEKRQDGWGVPMGCRGGGTLSGETGRCLGVRGGSAVVDRGGKRSVRYRLGGIDGWVGLIGVEGRQWMGGREKEDQM